jgi:hypothetical protein
MCTLKLLALRDAKRILPSCGMCACFAVRVRTRWGSFHCIDAADEATNERRVLPVPPLTTLTDDQRARGQERYATQKAARKEREAKLLEAAKKRAQADKGVEMMTGSGELLRMPSPASFNVTGSTVSSAELIQQVRCMASNLRSVYRRCCLIDWCE